jgi:uncharacterized protein YcgL (UPF0745 family)
MAAELNITQRHKILKSLNESVIPQLIQQGFYGKLPRYKRKIDN